MNEDWSIVHSTGGSLWNPQTDTPSMQTNSVIAINSNSVSLVTQLIRRTACAMRSKNFIPGPHV
jgi:hypothetical protein